MYSASTIVLDNYLSIPEASIGALQTSNARKMSEMASATMGKQPHDCVHGMVVAARLVAGRERRPSAGRCKRPPLGMCEIRSCAVRDLSKDSALRRAGLASTGDEVCGGCSERNYDVELSVVYTCFLLCMHRHNGKHIKSSKAFGRRIPKPFLVPNPGEPSWKLGEAPKLVHV